MLTPKMESSGHTESPMKRMHRFITLPQPLLRTFPIVWILALGLLVTLDIASKKMITDHLRFHLMPDQLTAHSPLPAEARRILIDRPEKLDILGPDGKYITFRLAFNDRFGFSIGPAFPLLSILTGLVAGLVLFIYRSFNPGIGHPVAWLAVFSGALGNLIDKLFLKSLATGEWTFSLLPKKGYIFGVVDFIECIWFGWRSDISLLSFLSWRTWPSFNLADSLLVVGTAFLVLSLWKTDREHSGHSGENHLQ